MEQHITIVAILSIIFGALAALVGIVLFVVIAGAGAASGDDQAMWITGAVGIAIASIFVVLSLPSIIGGIGLLKRRAWARVVILVVAALSLLSVPIGTAYGAYSIWVLINEESTPLFA